MVAATAALPPAPKISAGCSHAAAPTPAARRQLSGLAGSATRPSRASIGQGPLTAISPPASISAGPSGRALRGAVGGPALGDPAEVEAQALR